ncbi:MAG: hypothetical protein LBV51_03085, partial [Acholeplasmatales bacterium]|nr:hypothetical protein [Acholeplasmatales bacterium]
MDIENILNLKSEYDNLSVIKNYLNKNSFSTTDYINIYLHLLKVEYDLQSYSLLFEDSLFLLNSKKEYINNTQKTIICDYIIYSGTILKRYDETRKYINIKKDYLEISLNYLYFLDIINLNKITNEPYIQIVLNTLKMVLPNKVSFLLKREAFLYYYNENMNIEAYEYFLLLDNVNKEALYKEEIILLIRLQKYDEALLKLEITQNNKMDEAFVIENKLKIYINTFSYHKAINIDAEYSGIFDTFSEIERKNIYKLLMDLYEKDSNKYNFEIYNKKYKRLLKKDSLLNDNLENDEPLIEETQNVIVNINNSNPNFNYKEYVDIINNINDLIIFASNLNCAKEIDYNLRLLFIETKKIISNVEYGTFLTNSNTLYLYKVDRLYKKEIQIPILKMTPLYDVIVNGSEKIISKNNLSDLNNIFTNKKYEDEFNKVIIFPLSTNVIFYINLVDEIDLSPYYDFFHLLSSLVYYLLTEYKNNFSMNRKIKLYESILESSLLAVRIQTHNKSTYNASAIKMFDISAYAPIETFFSLIVPSSKENYIATNKKMLLGNESETQIIYYTNSSKLIKENCVSFVIDGIVNNISLFYDVTIQNDSMKKLENESIIDYETSLYNMKALENDSNGYFSSKTTFLLIKLTNDIAIIYPKKQVLNYFLEFINFTSKNLKNIIKFYRYNENSVIVALDINDIRSVTTTTNLFIEKLKNYLPSSISNETFKIKASLLRYPLDTTVKKVSNIIKCLEIALLNSKEDYSISE